MVGSIYLTCNNPIKWMSHWHHQIVAFLLKWCFLWLVPQLPHFVYYFGKGFSWFQDLCISWQILVWPHNFYCWWVVYTLWFGVCISLLKSSLKCGLRYLLPCHMEVVADVTTSSSWIFFYSSHNVSVLNCCCFPWLGSSMSGCYTRGFVFFLRIF